MRAVLPPTICLFLLTSETLNCLNAESQCDDESPLSKLTSVLRIMIKWGLTSLLYEKLVSSELASGLLFQCLTTSASDSLLVSFPGAIMIQVDPAKKERSDQCSVLPCTSWDLFTYTESLLCLNGATQEFSSPGSSLTADPARPVAGALIFPRRLTVLEKLHL